jgi:hypothetical protein
MDEGMVAMTTTEEDGGGNFTLSPDEEENLDAAWRHIGAEDRALRERDPEAWERRRQEHLAFLERTRGSRGHQRPGPGDPSPLEVLRAGCKTLAEYKRRLAEGSITPPSADETQRPSA